MAEADLWRGLEGVDPNFRLSLLEVLDASHPVQLAISLRFPRRDLAEVQRRLESFLDRYRSMQKTLQSAQNK